MSDWNLEELVAEAGLTVLGLAVAVGYAVDLFFHLLDGIKIGLGGTDKSQPKRSPASTT